MISADGERQSISLPQSAMLSVLSAGLGAVAASVAFILFSAFLVRDGSFLAAAPLALLFILIVSLVFAVPVSLIVGAPTIWAVQGLIARHPLISTIMLSLMGCALGYPIEQYLDANSIQRGADLPLYTVWGTVVGGVHGLVVCWVQRRSLPLAAKIAAIAILVVPVVAISGMHLFQNASARRSSACHYTVSELDHDLAMRADRALERSTHGPDRVTATIGDWERSDVGSSRAHSYSAVFVNGTRAIAINDAAVLPQSVLTDLGFESSVEQRCTDSYTGPHEKIVRRISKPVHLGTRRSFKNTTIEISPN